MPQIYTAVLCVFIATALGYIVKTICHLRLWLKFDGKIHIRVRLYLFDGLLIYDYLISGGAIDSMSLREKKLLSALISQKGAKPQNLFANTKSLLGKARADWRLNLLIGTDNAAATALVAGALTSVLKAVALTSLSLLPLQSQKICVSPAAKPAAKIEFSCMISIKTGHIIVIAAKMAISAAKNLFHSRQYRTK